MTRRRFLVPEVVQTSGMDCGPAALKSLLNGFGVNASYGRLREACQTGVDGTSIDTMEDIARQLGLDAEQVLVPVDHLFLDEVNLPSLVVVQLPGGAAHFVVMWRLQAGMVQLMDPATGRRWLQKKTFLEQVFLHTQVVSADDWREWAGSEEFSQCLRHRLTALQVDDKLLHAASEDAQWTSLGRLDAALRLATSLHESGAIRKGLEAANLLAELVADPSLIPPTYWCVQASESETDLYFRGAILVRVKGLLAGPLSETLSVELKATLTEQPDNPLLAIWECLRADGLLAPTLLATAIACSAAGAAWETVLFRGLFTTGNQTSAVLSFIAVMMLLEFPIAATLLGMGRRLEVRLRLRFALKIPLLNDRYFQSRLASDMAQRLHTAEQLREIPEMGGQLLRLCCELLCTVGAVLWLYPQCGVPTVIGGIAAAVLPFLGQLLMGEADFRWRNQGAALSRFYLDALLGLIAIRAHGAQRVMKREQSNHLKAWAKTGFQLQNTVVFFEGAQALLGFGLCVWMLKLYVASEAGASGILLLFYWALRIPALAQEIASLAWRYPAMRNITLRLLEPLGAPSEPREISDWQKIPINTEAVAIELRDVTVVAAGHPILDAINLSVKAGEHVGIVGPSGAGKSSLVGLLLGWHRPAAGQVLIDGKELTESELNQLRAQLVWVDPQVQLWNSSLLTNLTYGAEDTAGARLSNTLQQAQLSGMLDRLPDGIETQLGEGGALVSGGEGQRVRLGRAMGKEHVRLVILDEPARGLDGIQRKAMIAAARQLWSNATFLCITHDVAETLTFDRVLVMEHGLIVEDANPKLLLEQEASRYKALFDADQTMKQQLWTAAHWRRLRMEEGKLV